MKKKVLVVFPDGTGVRNYFYSDALPADINLNLFHNFSEETITYLRGQKHFETATVIPEYSETTTERFLRELICLSRLKHNSKRVKNRTIISFWNRKQKGLVMNLFFLSIEIASRLFGKYNSILNIQKRYEALIRKNPFYANVTTLLKEINPDVIFCTHQRGLKMPVIFAAAADLDIQTTTVIYSWDNLPKARLALKASQYLVWSDHMKNEMAIFYPEINPSQVIVSGTPQFDFYNDSKNVTGKEAFYSAFGLSERKRIICFSGDDEMTSPDDPKYLFDVASEIKNAGLSDYYQILFRRCPADFSGRFDEVIAKFPELIKESPPQWIKNQSEGWNGIYPLRDDVNLLISTAFYCDCVINVGSTMAFDFAKFNKPCLFINYDQEIKKMDSWSVNFVYKLQHFRSMEDLEPVGWINSVSDMVPLLEKVQSNPELVGPDRQQWYNKIVAPITQIDFD